MTTHLSEQQTVNSERVIRWLDVRRAEYVALLVLMFAFCIFCEVGWSFGEERPLLPWHTDSAAAYRDALQHIRPILVRVGAESCPWCKKLEDEIAKQEVQSQLLAWTLLYIDVDKSPIAALRLNVGPTPAIRILAPQGRLLVSHDGYLEAAELIEWMRQHYEEAVASADEVLLSDHEPSLLEVVRIVRQFNKRDAALREAAIRRLLPFPKTAGSAVVNSLREGKLSSRLVAYELLTEWHAPIGTLDPWRPETLTDESFNSLDKWLAEIDALPAPGTPKKLTPEQLRNAQLQIEQMLKADPTEAAAIRERLARLGRGLLPAVRAELQATTSDEQHERLVALRYRLVADDGLVLTWPGGLERLADTNPSVRHKAAEELAAMATAERQSLLMELFSDPDPLVREISLRGLQSVGGEQATAALVDLLNDPEPNVRAAVLKQLTEVGSSEMLSKVIEYIKNEQDPDLVVHAIRYFRETKSAKTVSSLLTLAGHQSWQVRAEAAETLGKTLENSRYRSSYSGARDRTVEIYDALLELLSDADAFVVSRALDGLTNVDAKRAVEPLVNAAAAHPPLASRIVDILAQGSEMRDFAVPHLRAFFVREDPAVRAAALHGLCKTDPENVKDELTSAARDEHTLVRTAAAAAMLEMLEESHPEQDDSSGDPFADPFGLFQSGLRGAVVAAVDTAVDSDDDAEPDSSDDTTEPASESDSPVSSDPSEDSESEDELGDQLDVWLTELYAGKHRAEWTSELVEPFQMMLGAEESEERVAAALALIPLGEAGGAIPILLDAGRATPALFSRAGESLRWLVWNQRVEVFRQLSELARDDNERATIVYSMNKAPDARAAKLYWKAIDRPDATELLAQAVQRSLSESYFGRRYYDTSSITTRMRKRAVADITPQLASGVPLKRLVAIDLLLKVAPDDAHAGAKRLMDDAEVDEALRSDAFQITLAAETRSQRVRTAIESLSGPDVHRRLVSLKFLAFGPPSLANLPATGFTINIDDDARFRSYSSGQPIIPAAPRRLEAEHVRPLVDDSDLEVAAYAGYLLALLQEPDGLTPLLRYWRSQERFEGLDRLVYRAIATLDDALHIAALKQIYARLDESEKGEFYWTIRIMSGAKILSFRKQIREEVGVSNLR